MPSSYIYKAEGERGKKGIFLTPQEDPKGSVTATLPSGQTISAQYVNTNEGRHQYLFGDAILGQTGVVINYNGKKIALEDANKSYEGNNPYDGWQYRAKGDLGSGGGGGLGGDFGGFDPSQIGLAFLAQYLGSMFPSPTSASFGSIKPQKDIKFDPITGKPINFTPTEDPERVGFDPVRFKGAQGFTAQYDPFEAAPYDITDPMEFGKKYGDVVRGEMGKNAEFANTQANKTLENELATLQNFVPAAAALKRQQTSADNTFNQAERTKQVDETLPGAREALSAQGTRARTYAEGGIPNPILDRTAEIQARSVAADQASGGGFGVQSSAARKASDSLSLQQRLQLSQFGEGLTGQNLTQSEDLLMAPTQYSDAGAQIKVNPSLSPAQLSAQYSSEANQLGVLPTSQAISAQIQQSQFGTQLEQSTRQTNAQNNLQVSEFNAGQKQQSSQFNAGTDLSAQQFNSQGKFNAGQFNSTSLQQNRQFNTTADLGTQQFNSQQDFNVQNVNSQGKFGAAQFNYSGRANTSQFNANGEFQESQFNANAQNTFALEKFQYDAGYAAAAAGAAQSNLNTGLALQQQQQAQQVFQDQLAKAQAAGDTQAVSSLLAQLPGLITGAATLVNSFSPSKPTTQNTNAGSGNTGSTGVSVPSVTNPEVGTIATPPILGGSDAPSTPTSIPTPPILGEASAPSSVSAPVVETGGTDAFPRSLTRSSLQALPSPAASPSDTQSFAKDAGSGGQTFLRSLEKDPQAAQTRALMGNDAEAVKNTAGIHSEPRPGLMRAGVTSTGKPVYTSPPLANSVDTGSGARLVDAIGTALDPTGAFSKEDASGLDKIAAISQDAAVLTQLNALNERGDTKGMANLMLSRFGEPAMESLVKDPQNKAGISTAFSAWDLAQNWTHMSPAQKTLGLTALGLKGFKFATGESLGAKTLIKPTYGKDGKLNSPGLNVGQALNLMSAGVNVYGLMKDWNQLNTLQKLTFGTGTAAQVAQTAKSMGLLGSGTANAAVPGVTAQTLQAAGWSSTPHLGVGAITTKAGSSIPNGYVQVSQSGDTVVAVPASTQLSSSPFAATVQGLGAVAMGAGAIQSYQQGNEGMAAVQGVGAGALAYGAYGAATGTPATIGGVSAGAIGGGVAVAAGAQMVYKGWGQGGKEGAINGAAGGTAVAAGMYAMGATNPYLLAAVVAFSVASNTMKTGKGEAQVERDGVRGFWEKQGFSKDHKVTLADGSQFDVGVDGHGNQHEFAHPEKLPKGAENRTLSAYDVDYTNDLDYSAAIGATTLSRLLAGQKGTNIDQLGGQLTNAAIANIGHGKEMSKENFATSMSNLRAFYAQGGIKSKQDAYALINQGFAEHRWDESDMVGMQQAANMVFDSDFNNAQRLMEGRMRGVEVAHEDAQAGDKPRVPVNNSIDSEHAGMDSQFFNPALAGLKNPTSVEAFQRSQHEKKGGREPYPGAWEITKGKNRGGSAQMFINKVLTSLPKTSNLTKSEMKQMNMKRYRQEGAVA